MIETVEIKIEDLIEKGLISKERTVLYMFVGALSDHSIFVVYAPTKSDRILNSPIIEFDFSARFFQAIRNDPTIEKVRDLKSRTMKELRKLSGFKDSCEKELAAFYKKQGIE